MKKKYAYILSTWKDPDPLIVFISTNKEKVWQYVYDEQNAHEPKVTMTEVKDFYRLKRAKIKEI